MTNTAHLLDEISARSASHAQWAREQGAYTSNIALQYQDHVSWIQQLMREKSRGREREP